MFFPAKISVSISLTFYGNCNASPLERSVFFFTAPVSSFLTGKPPILHAIATTKHRGNPPKVFYGKGVMKICSKFAIEDLCQSMTSITLSCNFIEITFRHGCSIINLLHIFRTPFPWNNSGGLLVKTRF